MRRWIVLTVALVLAGAVVATAGKITGTNGSDNLRGTNKGDRIDGRDGNDRILARNGNDGVKGGRGNDRINAGGGNDIVDGGSGNDVIAGGSGNDRIKGGTGRDTVNAGSGDDTVDTRDGRRDGPTRCAAGKDKHLADRNDPSHPDCEVVTNPRDEGRLQLRSISDTNVFTDAEGRRNHAVVVIVKNSSARQQHEGAVLEVTFTAGRGGPTIGRNRVSPGTLAPGATVPVPLSALTQDADLAGNPVFATVKLIRKGTSTRSRGRVTATHRRLFDNRFQITIRNGSQKSLDVAFVRLLWTDDAGNILRVETSQLFVLAQRRGGMGTVERTGPEGASNLRVIVLD